MTMIKELTNGTWRVPDDWMDFPELEKIDCPEPHFEFAEVQGSYPLHVMSEKDIKALLGLPQDWDVKILRRELGEIEIKIK